MDFKVLAVGDVVGNPGMNRIGYSLRWLKRKTGADFVVVNGENASVVGITQQQGSGAAAMLAAVQSRATARTIAPADMVNALAAVEKRLGISKKALEGCRVDIDVNAQTFPRAYEYTAESTQFGAVYMHGGWRVTYVGRNKCNGPSRRYVVDLTDAAKTAIIDRCTVFE